MNMVSFANGLLSNVAKAQIARRYESRQARCGACAGTGTVGYGYGGSNVETVSACLRCSGTGMRELTVEVA